MTGTGTQAERPSPFPKEGSKQRELLARLLAGDRVDPFTSLMEMNLLTVNARASELRGMGWPVMSDKEPHPKLGGQGEKIVVYYFDTHFRHWMGQNPGAHPQDYPGQEGRGKFASDAATKRPDERSNRLQSTLNVLLPDSAT